MKSFMKHPKLAEAHGPRCKGDGVRLWLRKRIRLAAIVGLTAGFSLVGIAPVHASTSIGMEGGVIRVVAEWGAKNHVAVNPASNGEIAIYSEPGNNIGAGCRQVPPGEHWVRCSLAGVSRIEIQTRDMDDYVKVDDRGSLPIRVSGGLGDDWLTGRGDLNGSGGNDTIFGYGHLSGGTGDDTIKGHGTLEGGHGVDDLSTDNGTASRSVITGGPGNDTLRGHGDLWGDEGNDFLDGSGQGTSLRGDDGNDTLIADGTDIATGGNDNDGFQVGTGSGQAFGGLGDDTFQIWGLAQNPVTPGTFTLDGNDGDDKFLDYYLGSHVIRGGAGYDSVSYSGRQSVSVNLGDSVANDGGPGEKDNLGPDIEELVGTNGNDILIGSDGSNLINGMAGDDTILGQGGDDSLRGEMGADTLIGNAGSDFLSGGINDDVLNARDAVEGNDRIRAGTGDDVCIADPGDRKNSCNR